MQLYAGIYLIKSIFFRTEIMVIVDKITSIVGDTTMLAPDLNNNCCRHLVVVLQ